MICPLDDTMLNCQCFINLMTYIHAFKRNDNENVACGNVIRG